jgi:hypothetical protein
MPNKRSKEKSILDKFTEMMKGLADNASHTLKSEEPARTREAARKSKRARSKAAVSKSATNTSHRSAKRGGAKKAARKRGR